MGLFSGVKDFVSNAVSDPVGTIGGGLVGGSLLGGDFVTGGLLGGSLGSQLGITDGIGKTLKSATGTNRLSSPYDAATMSTVKMLQDQAAGKGPSLVEESAKQQHAKNLANTVGAIRSGGGMSQALKNRMIARAGEGQGAKIAQDATLGKVQEQLGAQKNLASMLTGVRGQDLDSESQRASRKSGLFTEAMSSAGSIFGLGAG